MSLVDEKIDEMKAELAKIELDVTTQGYTLADAIREGSMFTEQSYNWGNGPLACALTAAYLAGKARGVIE